MISGAMHLLWIFVSSAVQRTLMLPIAHCSHTFPADSALERVPSDDVCCDAMAGRGMA